MLGDGRKTARHGVQGEPATGLELLPLETPSGQFSFFGMSYMTIVVWVLCLLPACLFDGSLALVLAVAEPKAEFRERDPLAPSSCENVDRTECAGGWNLNAAESVITQ